MKYRLAYPLPTVWFAALAAVSGLALFAWPGRSWWALGVVENALLVVVFVDAVFCVAPRRIDVSRDLLKVGHDLPIALLHKRLDKADRIFDDLVQIAWRATHHRLARIHAREFQQ